MTGRYDRGRSALMAGVEDFVANRGSYLNKPQRYRSKHKTAHGV
jgi:hypothetical protein